MGRTSFLTGFFSQYRGPILVGPAIIVLLGLNIFPLLWSYGLSFFRYRANRQAEPQFRGLYYFEKVLGDDTFWERLQITGYIVGMSVIGQLIIGFALAMFFAKAFPGRRYLLTLVLAPMMLSMAAVGVFFRFFFDPSFGPVSYIIQALIGVEVSFLTDASLAPLAIAITDIWMWSPFVMLLVLAGLVSVPEELYEAALIDRMSRLRTFFIVTFPHIRGLLLLALLFRTIESFKIFDLVILMTDGGPGVATETISIYVYRFAFQYFKTSEASAMAYLLLFIVIVLTSLYLYFVNQRNREHG